MKLRSRKLKTLRRGWAVGRAAALMSLTPACAVQALAETYDEDEAYRRVLSREADASNAPSAPPGYGAWANTFGRAAAVSATGVTPQRDNGTSRQGELDVVEPLEVDLGDRLGVLSQGRLGGAAAAPRSRTLPRQDDGVASERDAHLALDEHAALAALQPPAHFRWRAPFTGRFRVEFWPEDEPPFRYQLRVLERSGGRVLHDSEAYGSGVVFEIEEGSELQIAVRVTQPAGDNRYRLELHEAGRAS